MDRELWLDGLPQKPSRWWGFARDEEGNLLLETMDPATRDTAPVVSFPAAEARQLLAWLKAQFPEEG